MTEEPDDLDPDQMERQSWWFISIGFLTIIGGAAYGFIV